MKITHILWGLKTGGIETMLVDLVNVQVKTEEVSIVIINNIVDQSVIEKIDKRCKVYMCNRPVGSLNPFYVLKLNIILLKLLPHIIHFHYTGIVNYILIHAVKVLTIHNTHSSTVDFNSYDMLFSISNSVRDYTLSQGFQSIVVPNGIPVSSILCKDSIAKKNQKKIVQIGRLYHPHKGQHIVLDALSIIVKYHPTLNFTMDFIGEGDSIEYLRQKVKEYNLESIVNFLGGKSREYIYANLRNYDLLVQPSISEGFGLTVVEALAAKIPIIISDLPSLVEVTCNGKYAEKFMTENPMSLAEKIYKVLTDEMFIDFGESKNYVIENYDISNTALKYMVEYKKISKQQK